VDWREIHASVAARCERGGLDLVHPFSREGRFALLIANSKKLWPAFLAQADLSLSDPLDRHVVTVITEALAPFPHQVRFAHVPPFLPIQRIAEEAGMARLSLTHLSIHPEYGPWIGLRALALFPVPGPEAPPLQIGCEGCEVRCRAALDAAMGGGDWRAWLAVRDACNVGRSYRYGEDQIVYHYTKVRSW
jgi:methylmalonic aciduria homocystinuria type C protein